MKVLVTVDHHFIKTSDGKIWVPNIHDQLFWQRYLNVFDEVDVVCRMVNKPIKEKDGFLLSSMERVNFIQIPDFRGPKEYLKKFLEIQKTVSKLVMESDCDCAIVRLPSTIGYLFIKKFIKTGKPIAVEVVADPYDSYQGMNVVMSLVRFLYVRRLKKACKMADGVSYVTQHFLQKRYPSRSSLKLDNKSFEGYYSSIDLPASFFFQRPSDSFKKDEYTIVHVSNIESENKGHRLLLNAVRNVLEQGFLINVKIIGDGSMRRTFETFAEKIGVMKHVKFLGLISNKNELKKELMSSDLFVFPTKAEGLPRVLIEAMACGLPCISTPVGGIPELLENEDLIEPNDLDGFVKRIIFYLSNPNEMQKKSIENFRKAEFYKLDLLTQRRTEFYTKLKNLCIKAQ